MNIAMLSYHTCPLATLGGKDTGGMNVYVRDLTRYLGRLGVHVDVFTRSQDEHVPHVLHDLGYGNRVVHVPAGPEHPLSKEDMVRYIPAYTNWIRQFAESKGIHYDLIHSHYWMSGLAAIELKAAWDIPILHMFHTLVHMKNRIARSDHEIERGYRLKGEQDVLDLADKIVVATPAEQAQLEFLYLADSRKLVTIPPGVDTSRFYPIPKDEAKSAIGVDPGDHLMLFVGRIEPLKGIDTLIRALAIMDQSGEMDCCPHQLAIIGGDPEASAEAMNVEMSRIQALVAELGIKDLVLFLGKRGQDSLPYYYSAAEVVVMPSHYESFGMVALEAMACGTPVVASQVGGLAFLVQDGVTGYVVPGGDPAALAGRLLQLAGQPGLREQLGSQGAAYAREFGWDKISARILNLYNEMLHNPEPTASPIPSSAL